MIDFKKPIRLTDDNAPAHFIGQRLDGRFVIEGGEDRHSLFCVDENGFVPNWRTKMPLIENVPERHVEWIIVYPGSGWKKKEQAIEAASTFRNPRVAVIKVEYEAGERP